MHYEDESMNITPEQLAGLVKEQRPALELLAPSDVAPPPPFEAFRKIPRLRRGIVITEKIDGTNAQILVTADGRVYAGSRNRWITPASDNAGFAAWVEPRKAELAEALGPGQHFGEWWGAGIQRRYGLPEKRLSLFNATRWAGKPLPEGVGVVPILYAGDWAEEAIQGALDDLRRNGSRAAPGFMKPEGIVVFHSASGGLFKVLLENDALPKGATEAA